METSTDKINEVSITKQYFSNQQKSLFMGWYTFYISFRETHLLTEKKM